MSLGLELSRLRVRISEALANEDGQQALDVLASYGHPICNALDRLNGILRNFDKQKWARDAMRVTCNDFGTAPPVERENEISLDSEPLMKRQLREYLDRTGAITSDNIGHVRRSLFMPFECDWNKWVRELTGARENKPAPR